MKLNQTTHITGNRVELIPYKKEHVPKYHNWMLQEDLREATGSDLLNLDEEFMMQNSWWEDENSEYIYTTAICGVFILTLSLFECTFIVTDKVLLQETKNEVIAMIGDVNLFLRENEDKKIAEVSIMIAEKIGRKQGKGFEALCLMLNYGVQHLNVDTFEAKIGFRNTASINLFKKAGFQLVNSCEIFQEATFIVHVTSEWKAWLLEITTHAIISS